MRAPGPWLILAHVLLAAAGMWSPVEAVTRYSVRLDTVARAGQRVLLAFDFTSGSATADTLEILDFALDGKAGPVVSPGKVMYEGGPAWGDLVGGAYPAPRTVIANGSFYNQLTVPVDSLGTRVTFALRLPDPPRAPGGLPDQMSFFLLGADGLPAFVTQDPLGANALFAVGVTGVPGGDLNVFAPMTFIPPDTLALDLGAVEVPGKRLSGRLWVHSVRTASGGEAVLVYEVPKPGGSLRIRVFDATGRLVAEPLRTRRDPGMCTTVWNGRDSRGRRLPPGEYVAQLQMGGQSAIRRFTVAK